MKNVIRLKTYLKKINKKTSFNNKYINAKLKINNNVVHTQFYYKKMFKDNKHCKHISIAPKENECYTYLSTILLDSILVNSNNEHCPLIFSEKCLYAVNKKVLDTNVKILTLDEYFDESKN